MSYIKICVSLILITLPIAVAEALPVTTSQSLNFSAGKQSLWGPGGAAASFKKSGSVGNTTLGFKYSAKASSGTVESARFAGQLRYSYDDYINVNADDLLSMQFIGNPNGGLIDTLFGASLTTEYQILGFTGCIFCAGLTLDIDQSFTPRLDRRFSGSDTATPVTLEVGPNLGLAAATAGVDIDLTQTSSLTGTGITGMVTATNRGSGTSLNQSVSVLNNGIFNLDLGLDEVGIWDVSLTNLSLSNQFFSSFGLSLVPFVQYFVGLGCGEPGTDSDNGIFCASDGRADFTLANLDLGSTQAFALNFNSLNLNPFSIETFAAPVAQVPEPGSITLLAIGLLALGLLRLDRAGG